MAESDLDRDSLKIGDYIIFSDILGCFLSVEGILLEELVGVDAISSLHDSVFCVHLQRQYSAARELNAFLEKYGMDVKNITEDSELKYLQALERGTENENKLNDNYMRKKLGQVVLFGEIIQLYHVKSGKYLQVLPGKLAKEERENTRVGLDLNGNAYSWIQICPRFKIDKDGDRILSNVEVYLKVAERTNEFIHSAGRELISGQHEREVNCSLESTSWRLNIFQSSKDALDRDLLLASQLVYINDPELESYLTVAERAVKNMTEAGDEDKVKDFVDETKDEEETEEPDTVVLRPSASLTVDSNFLWFLESNSILVGGPIKWKTDQVRFKHVNTSKYLCQETRMVTTEEGYTRKTWTYVTTEDPSAAGTLFSVNELNSTAKHLCSGKASQLGHGSVWIERGGMMPSSSIAYKIQGTKDKTAAVSLVVNHFKGTGVGAASAEDDATRSAAKPGSEEEEEEERDIEAKSAFVGPKQPLDIFAGLSARNYLEKYCKMTKLTSSANTIWPSGSRADLDMFKMIVAKTVIFAQGFPISATNVKVGIDKSDPELRRKRQNLLREQGTVEIVLHMISKLIPLSEAAVQRPTAANVDSSFLAKMGRNVLELCFTVLYNAIQENQENQIYVADYMPVLLAHLNTQPVSVKCVTEMLSKNMKLQETKVGDREIQIFVDKLRSSRMNAMYLQLLQACCSCEGKGVDNNQCKVATMLFEGDYSDIIVTIEVNNNKLSKVSWVGDTALYLSPPGGSAAQVKGHDVIFKGLPMLYLKWQNKGETFTAPIEEVFHVNERGMGLGSTSDDKNDEEKSVMKQTHSFKMRREMSVMGDRDHKLANYFVAEMFLAAEMCMDRNYVAMHKLDDLFTYEMLVSILKMNVRSSVKSAAVRLLMCLHVDRDPQAVSKIPVLTRVWSDIKKNPEPQLPYVDISQRFKFGLIQQMISEHINGMSGNRWDELSRHMLKMLRTLVSFNFYGTNERMKDVIGPLIRALDRRHIDFAAGDFVPDGPTSVKVPAIQLRPSSEKVIARRVSIDGLDENSSSLEQGQSFEDDIEDDAQSTDSEQAELRKTIKATENRKAQFQRYLDFIDSFRVYLAMMALVLADVIVDIYHLSTGQNKYDIPSNLFYAEAAIMLVFVIELLCRTVCLLVIDKNFTGIYMDFYNMADLIAVVLNVAFLFKPELYKTGAGFVLVLRFLKFVRMLRATTVRIIAGDEGDVKLDKFKTAARYSIAPIHELETMVEVVDILAFMQHLIEDRNISLVMHNFYAWENGSDRRSPAELFEAALVSSKELSLDIADFDNVMLDVLMFVHRPLVQSTLECLMAHHSRCTTLLSNIQKVQLLASPKREKQHREVNAMLQELEQNAETHELWGELETDQDRETNARTKEILKKLSEIARVPHFVLEFDEEFHADSEIQDLYRNLGCFEICMKVMNLLDSVDADEDGVYQEAALNTRDLCLQCNMLLYWYFLGNALNQEQGYSQLSFFLDSLDKEIKSHHVVGAIFKDNERLMRLSPYSHLNDLVKMILQNGKSHHYLALFASISNVGDRNITENQFQIVKVLTSPGILKQVSAFFCSVDDPEYDEKRKLMEPFLDHTGDLALDDLPPLLAYHLMFLEVLSDCTIGRFSVTTVEAKVQSVFNYVDILRSILDEGTITFTKTRLSMFFYNSIIEVELKISGLEQSAYIWELLKSYKNVMGFAKEELRAVEKLGWDSPEVSRQRIEYIMVCIMITGGFFSRYYDANTFRFSEGAQQNMGGDKVYITLAQVNDLIRELFDKIKAVYDLDSPRLSAEMKAQIFSACESLNKSATKIIDNNLVPTSVNLREMARTETWTNEAKLVQKFRDFHEAISTDPGIQKKADTENYDFVSLLENLPTISDTKNVDVRYETLIRKLVFHIRDNFTQDTGERRLDARVTKTAIWIIRSFRTMIENKMGMSIYERDDDGGEEEDDRAAPVVNALNNCGATALCLDLIAFGIDKTLQMEAVKLGVGLLFKEGGALEVQGIMNNHLSKTQSELFFKQVRQTLADLQTWHKWNENTELQEGGEPEIPPEILIVRFLQLMCEGHYLPNQDILREQPTNAVSYNLLDDFVGYFNALSRFPCRTSTVAAIRLSATILEVIQGPCEGNQAHFALNTELIETLNRINRAKIIKDCVEEEEIELKKTSIDIFQGLLEGQGEKSVVYERVLSVIHLDIIQMMSKGVSLPDSIQKDGKLAPASEPSEDQEILQTECMVLLQMLCNFKPSLYDELGISQKVEDVVGSGTAMIEIVWRGDIHRRFFHVPTVCDFLAKSSKDSLVENVDRSNSENKLIDLLARSHDLYREVKHQQLLTELGLSRIFSREIQDIATWITFAIAVLINVMFIAFYNYPDDATVPEVTSFSALTAINSFNILQNVVGGFVIIMNVVVRSPVIYQSLMAEEEMTKTMAVLYTAMDAKTIYFGGYLVLSLLGLLAADYYLPFLLLDIVAKNATTRDVLNAVVIPRKQLGMTVVLGIFFTYIFAYFIFKYFRGDIGGLMGNGVYPGDNDCNNLWGCFKFVLCYGVRQGGGVGDAMKLTIGSRWLINETYFLVMIVMMLNIIFGIIIDTFSSLRSEKNELIEDTVGVCFICGIDNQVFDRASAEPDGFQTHIKSDHNMWNYLYFIFMLWEQDKDDDDGLEQYVRRAIDANEITWFPLNKAIRLDQAATEEELTLQEIATEINAFELALGHKIQHFQSDMSAILETISQATRMDHKKGSAKDDIAAYMRNSIYNPISAEDLGDNMSDIATVGNSTVLEAIDEEEDDMPHMEGHTDHYHSDGDDDGEGEEGDHLTAHKEGGSDDDLSDEDRPHGNPHHRKPVSQVSPKSQLEESGSKLGFGSGEDEPAVFPGASERLVVNSVVEGSSVLIKERSAAFWDMEGISVPGTAHTGEERSRVPTASDFGLHRPGSTPLVLVKESDEFHAAAVAAVCADPDVTESEKAETPLEQRENVIVLPREEHHHGPPEPHTFEEGVNANAVESERVPAAAVFDEFPETPELLEPELLEAVISELTAEDPTQFSFQDNASVVPDFPSPSRADFYGQSPDTLEEEQSIQEFGVPVDLASKSGHELDLTVVGESVLTGSAEESADSSLAGLSALAASGSEKQVLEPAAPADERELIENERIERELGGDIATVSPAVADNDSEPVPEETAIETEKLAPETVDEVAEAPVLNLDEEKEDEKTAEDAEGGIEGSEEIVEEGDEEEFEPEINYDPSQKRLDYLAGDAFRVTHLVEEDSQVNENESLGHLETSDDHEAVEQALETSVVHNSMGHLEPAESLDAVEHSAESDLMREDPLAPVESMPEEHAHDEGEHEPVTPAAVEEAPAVDEAEMDSEEVAADESAKHSAVTVREDAATEDDGDRTDAAAHEAPSATMHSVPSWTEAPASARQDAPTVTENVPEEAVPEPEEEAEPEAVAGGGAGREQELTGEEPSETAHENVEEESTPRFAPAVQHNEVSAADDANVDERAASPMEEMETSMFSTGEDGDEEDIDFNAIDDDLNN